MSSVLPSPAELPRLSRVFLVVGALSLLAATQLSALGFHALSNRLTPAQLEAWHWATELQFHQSLGLILVALLAARLGSPRLLAAAGAIMILGLFLFSGTIYVNTLGILPVGQLAPLGGGSFMLAWLLVAIAAFRARSSAG
jgi:uncharacterized membrane protein YgdD (TMEM256/DUF423 family)